MSSNLKYKQVANVERRTWDVEAYEKKARARKEAAERGELPRKDNTHDITLSSSEREEFTPAEQDAIGPEGSKRAFLKSRKSKVDVDSKVGTSEMVSVEAAAAVSSGDSKPKAGDGVVKTGIGWHCKVCDCFLKDSHTYLDHINGRKHQRNLGFSMRVERSTKEQLLDRLKYLKKEKEDKEKEQKAMLDGFVDEPDYSGMVKAKDEEAQRLKEERKRRRKEKKAEKRKQQTEGPATSESTHNETEGTVLVGEDGDNDGQGEQEAGVNPELAAMMGFSGFGGA